MSKLLKIFLIFFSSIFGLVLAAVIIIPLVVDLNDYKPEIETAVKEQTGRQLSIVGELELSIFPWVGVSTGEIIFSNAEGFTPDSFAVIKHSDIKVKLTPLLSKELEVSTIVLKGLELNLAKNKQGVSNWADLIAKEPETKAVQQQAPAEPVDATPALASLMIGGLTVEGARVTWDDKQAGQKVIIKDFNLKTGKISLDEAIDIQLSLFIDNQKPAVTEALSLSTQLKIDNKFQLIQLNNTEINSVSKGAIVPNGAMDVQLLSDIILDLKQESIALEKLNIAFDDTKINGFLHVKQFNNPAIEFKLAINEIDVDRYSPKKKLNKTVPSPAVVAAAASSLIPVKTIRELNINGDLAIGLLKASGLTVREVSLNLQAKNGVLRTRQAINKLYGGEYKGQLTLNAKSRTPKISLNEKINKVQIGQLLHDLRPNEPAKLTGAVNLAAKLNTRGNSVASFKSNLGGNLSFSVNKGAVQGINIQQMIDMGKLFSGKAMKQNYANEQTLFSSIKGTGTVRRGVITNPDFLLSSKQLLVNGAGTVNLVNEAVKYSVKAKLTHKATKNRPVAIKVAGTISEPTYTADVLSMINEKEKQKIDKAVDKALGKGGAEAVNKLLESFF